MDFVFQWISSYGYLALFGLLVLGIVGLPIPDETLLVFTGYLVSQRRLSAIPALMVAFLGSTCGITLSYSIGRTLGLGFVHKYGRRLRITEERLARVHRWFDRIGHWTLFVGYYIAGVRHFTALVAGTSSLEYRSFAAYAYSGGFLWVCTFLGIGYVVGDRWQQAMETVHRNLTLVSMLALGAAIAYAAVAIARARMRANSASRRK
jgi:membrane protein DedA with SNARE-associated domain